MKTLAVSPLAPSLGWAEYLTTLGGLATVSALTSTADAAIVYVDPTDVTVTSSGTIYFDLDQSGTAPFASTTPNANSDFELRLYQPTVLAAQNYSSTRFVQGDTRYTDKLVFGATIGSGNTFQINRRFLSYYGSGPWNNGEGYLGLRIGSGAAATYGWARVSYNGSDSVTLKDFAYQTTANTAILAGQVPEPSVALLLALGAGGVAMARRRETLAA